MKFTALLLGEGALLIACAELLLRYGDSILAIVSSTGAILNQEPAHGVTWHEMRETVDAGDILEQRLFPLAPDETAFSLNRRCLEAGIESFDALVRGLRDGTLERRAQDPAARTYFGRHARPAAQACIDWTS